LSSSRVIAVPTFDSARRIDIEAPAGSTVAEIVKLALPGAMPTLFDQVRVTIGDVLVPREYWTAARPKPGAIVLVRVMPGNGGILRTVLSIAVSVAAIALGQLWLGPLLASSAFGTAIGLTSASASALASGVAMLAGQALLNAIVPLRPDRSKTGLPDSPTYSVQGFKNVANIDGIIPCPLGTIRFAPPYWALPYTEIVGGEMFVTALFVLGYGPLEIRDLRFGDTPIEKFKEVEIEIRQGYDDDDPITLYPKQVLEQRLSVDLNKVYSDQFGAHTRFTASDVTETSVDLFFPGGMFWMHTQTSGSSSSTYPRPFWVTFRISERKDGVGDWTEVAIWNVAEFKQKEFYATYKWTHSERGRWEIKIERLTPDFDDLALWNQYDQISSRAIWQVLRSFRPEYPVNCEVPLALIAIRVKGTKQLNGVIDDFNCEVGRICLDWDSEEEEWVERETRNPASLLRYAMQGPMNVYPFEDEEIDLAFLENEFHPFCEDNNLHYDRVHDFESTLYDDMADICAAGRGYPRDDGEKWTVVIDRRRDVVHGLISPRNSYDLTGERPYVIFPDAFRVKFQDSTNDYKQAERVIPWPGFVGAPSRTESIDIPGVCDPDNVWLEARKRQYELMYRPDIWNLMQDAEGMFAARGDMCELNHWTLNNTQRSAFVKAIRGNAIVLDDLVTMESGKSYAIRIRKLAANDVDEDQSVLRTVQTIAGEQDALFLTGSGTSPDAGDMIFFGEATKVSEQVLVKNIESTQNLGVRHTLMPYAPEIFDALDEEEPPAWNGRVGAEVIDPTVAPDVPEFGVIISGDDASFDAPNNVYVTLIVSAWPEVSYIELQHRILGDVSWTTTSVPPGNVVLTDYDDLDEIELRARAVGVGSSPLASDWSDTYWHVVSLNNEAERDFGLLTDSETQVIDFGSIADETWQSVDAGTL
jgi:hypothetical protein